MPSILVQLNKSTNVFNEIALLDSGANLNCLSHEMFIKLLKYKSIKKYNKYSLPCYGADNRTLNVTGSCVVKIKISRFCWNVRFNVVKGLSWDIVLGNCFMRETNMILDLSKDICYFNFCPQNKIKLGMNNVNVNPSKRVVSNLETSNDIDIGCADMKPDVMKLINSYPNVFTTKTGKALNFEFEIKLKDNESVNQRPYPLSPARMEEMKVIINDLLEQNIIRPSTSSYSAPSFLVKKPNSQKSRLVINYSKLNQKIERVNHPLGNMEETYHYLQDAEYFSVIDLTNSFMQIPLKENCKHLTAFSTPMSLFEFQSVPFGLHLGSGLLSSYLDNIFRDLRGSYLISFVDDILIFSKSKELHMSHLTEVIERLSKNNLTVNPSKVKLFQTEVSYLGHVVSKNQIRIDESRTESIRNFQSPKTAKEVGRFVGMVSYFSKYVKNYADLAAPLNDLRKKRSRFKWTELCENNFNLLKNAIMNPPVLTIPDYKKPFYLMTDASQNACGSVLLQRNEEGDNLPIAYYSKKFTDSERNLSIYYKEALSVVLSIKRFYNFLEVQSFYLYTDNNALSWVLSHFTKLGKLARWAEYILSLPFKVMHVKSNLNPVADALSRMFEEKEMAVELVEVNPNELEVVNQKFKTSKKFRSVNSKVMNVNVINDVPLAYVQISEHQKLDQECLEIMQSVKNKTNKSNFYINNNVLMYKKNDKCKGKIYVPESLIDLLFTYYHLSPFGGHPGQTRTVAKVIEHFYHPNLIRVIRGKVKACDICKMAKPALRRYEGELISGHSLNPLDTLYVDTAGPLVRTSQGNCHIIIAVDDMTKYVWLIPVRDIRANTVIRKLEEIVFTNFGACTKLVSDNGPCFKSYEFKKLMFQHAINHYKIIPYRASANKAERYILNLKNQLRAYFNSCQNKWDQNVKYIQLSLNTALNESTKYTSFELMFKHKPNHGLSNLWKLNELVNSSMSKSEIKDVMDRAIKNCKISISKNKNRDRYNLNKIKHPFKIGSRVFLENQSLSSKVDKYQAKMDFRYKGPYRIIYFLSPVSVLIQMISDSDIVKRAHIHNLKLG